MRGVPRVSPAYQARRRQHILRAARACFSRLGFHATSMQDILREADVSAGALYCYFQSKDDLVVVIIDEVLDELSARVASLASREDPLALVRVVEDLLGVFEERTGPDELARLAVQVWAESLYDPGVKARLAAGYARMRDILVGLLAQAGSQPRGLADVPVTAVGQLLLGLGQAWLLQGAVLGEPEAAGFRDALCALFADRQTAPESRTQRRRL